MGGVQFCCLCADQQPRQANQYHYQVYKKIPLCRTIQHYRQLKATQGQRLSTDLYQNLRSLNSQTNSVALPEMQGAVIPPPSQSLINTNQFVNNTPIDATAAKNATIFDLAAGQTFVKKIKKSNYTELIKSLEGTGQKYTDLGFGHSDKSIGKVKNLDISKVQWLRVSELMKNPVFVRDRIQPSDILQGVLGDCYLLSSLAALAEQEYRIKSVFPSLEISPYGIYMARLLHNGVYQQVLVDDYFPANVSGEPIFAKPSGKNEIWVMILEKCWAKLYGSYENITAGLPNQALHALSSAPVFMRMIYSDAKKQEAIWGQLMDYDKSGALLCCGTKNDPEIEKLGFVKGHAYTILGVYDKPERLIKLRNPWGFKQWRGRASDHDVEFWSKRTLEEKKALEYEDSQRNTQKDGVFFVVWQDFLKYFQLIDICKINDNAHYNFLESDFEHLSPKLFEFEVRGAEAKLTFAATQANKRGTMNDYSRSYLALGKWDQVSKSYKYVKGGSDRNLADNYLQIQSASAGKYLLYVNYLWNKKGKYPAVVSIYSQSPAHIAECHSIQPTDFLAQLYYDHACRNAKRKIISGSGDWLCSEVLLNEGGFGYFVVSVDRQSKAKYGVTATQSQFSQKNLKLQPPYRGLQTIQIEVSASKTPLIMVAELISFAFPERIASPTPTVVPLN